MFFNLFHATLFLISILTASFGYAINKARTWRYRLESDDSWIKCWIWVVLEDSHWSHILRNLFFLLQCRRWLAPNFLIHSNSSWVTLDQEAVQHSWITCRSRYLPMRAKNSLNLGPHLPFLVNPLKHWWIPGIAQCVNIMWNLGLLMNASSSSYINNYFHRSRRNEL